MLARPAKLPAHNPHCKATAGSWPTQQSDKRTYVQDLRTQAAKFPGKLRIDCKLHPAGEHGRRHAHSTQAPPIKLDHSVLGWLLAASASIATVFAVAARQRLLAGCCCHVIQTTACQHKAYTPFAHPTCVLPTPGTPSARQHHSKAATTSEGQVAPRNSTAAEAIQLQLQNCACRPWLMLSKPL